MTNENIILNPLPVPTWNSLKINEASYPGAVPADSCTPEIKKLPDSLKLSNNEALSGIKSAAGDGLSVHLNGDSILIESESEASPAILNYDFTGGKQARLFLHARENAVLPISVVMTGEGTAVLEIKIQADSGSAVDLSVIQAVGSGCDVITDIGCTCENNATFNLTKLELGGKSDYVAVSVDLAGEHSTFSANSGYRVKTNQSLDMNYVVRHTGRKTESNIFASGILENDSTKLFRGTIDLIKGCAGAKGTENEDILLLGDNQVNQTIPLILCDEEDVEGNHGASIGRLDDNIIFYLGSRGISPEAAEDIIAHAKLDAIISHIPDEEIKTLAHSLISTVEADGGEDA
ncbi:MAG: SufD family Fe-S cluster assembly protein [Oscillospiraceae bacterium]|nr:SufD family Fe-S cluster assembly protein [Oscillospiraceae bacterium]